MNIKKQVYNSIYNSVWNFINFRSTKYNKSIFKSIFSPLQRLIENSIDKNLIIRACKEYEY